MITKPTDHELYVIQIYKLDHHPAYMWFVNFIFLVTTMSSSTQYLIVAITSFLLYLFGYQLVLALSGAKVLCVVYKAKQFALIIGSQKLFTDQRFSNLVLIKQEEYPHVLQKKATEKSYEWSGKRDSWLDAARFDS